MAALVKRYTDQLTRDLELVIGETTVPLDARNQAVRRYTSLASGEVLIAPAGGPLMVTVVIDAVQRLRTVSPRLEGRITVMR